MNKIPLEKYEEKFNTANEMIDYFNNNPSDFVKMKKTLRNF